MTIKQITIKGVDGDVEIHAADYGAQILYADVCLELARGASDEERWTAARAAAMAIYGADFVYEDALIEYHALREKGPEEAMETGEPDSPPSAG